jgi:rRNA maturation protein Nop10
MEIRLCKYKKQYTLKKSRTGGMAQAVEHLPGKHKALS